MKRHNHLTSVIVGVVLLTLALLGSAFVALAPSFYALENIQISPTAGVVLGHKALGQKPGYFSADQQHLKVRYDSKQAAWYLTNVSANKKVLAKLTGGGSLFLKTGYLQVGDTIYLDDQHIRITQLKPLQFDLIESGKSSKITWDNGELTREGIRNFAGCDKAWWKTLLGHDQGFTLGGKVQCVDRLKIHNIPLASAKIDKDEQGYYLRPLNNQIYIGFQPANTNQRYQANNIEHPAKLINQLIIGRTLYRVSQTVGAHAKFSLTPVANFHLFNQQPDTSASSSYTLTWTPEAAWSGKLGRHLTNPSLTLWVILGILLISVWTVGSLIAALRHQLLREQSRWKAPLLLLPPALLLWAGLWLNPIGYQLISVWLSWTWLSLLMYQQRLYTQSFAFLWATTLAIAGIGLLTQLQLAIGADSTRWLQYPSRHIQFMLLTPLLLTPFILAPTQALQSTWRFLTNSKLAKAVVLLLIGIALLLQLVAGDEKGIFGFQPVELTKTVLVFMLSGFAVNWFHLRQVNALTARQNKIKQLAFFGWVLLLAVVVYIIVLGGVRDFSPILIIGGLLLAFLWVMVKLPHLPTSPLTWAVRLTVLLSLCAILGLGLYILDNPERTVWLSWLPQAERIALWADPWNYPDTGRQLQLALEAVHGGIKDATSYNWLGAQWFGLNSGRLLSIPAIQDDFILAFYLHQWGGLAGLILLLLQIIWVLLLFGFSQQLLLQAEQRNRDQRLSYRFLAYIVYGMAWLHILHWLISWGNTLGILPIMGQPMTWLSSGMSHLLAIALPSLGLMLLASRFLQEEK